MSAALKVEVAVIGAGVIGLACARNFAIRGKEVLILDRAGQIGSGVRIYTHDNVSITDHI
jgi:NADPH-dependent 2,4-dienoyl-CoA reductase/sulfur reductase-like enzyme